MGTCSPTNNPSKVYCPTEGRRFAIIGGRETGDWSHNTDEVVELTTPYATTELSSIKRTMEVTWNYYEKPNGAIACMWPDTGLGYSEGAYLSVDSYDSEPYLCTFNDSIELTSSEILFLDLRHDILVRKETKHTGSKAVESSDSTLWNTGTAAIKFHKIKPNDLDLTETTTLYINDIILEQKVSSNYSEIPWTYSIPPSVGLPQTNTETDGANDEYYIWSLYKDHDGGYDLYYPDYIEGIDDNLTSFLEANRDRHRELGRVEPYTREPINASTTSFSDVVVYSTSLNGAWATSPLKIGDTNYKFYCTKLSSGKTVELLDPPPPEVSDVLESSDTLLWPIAPL